MRNAPRDLPEFKWAAVCVPLVLVACGGGSGTGVTGASVVGTAPQKSATGTDSGAAAGDPTAAALVTVAGSAPPLPPLEPAPPPKSGFAASRKVTTPAEIAARRALERDHPAPIDRGTATGRFQPATVSPGAMSATDAAAAPAPNTVGQWSIATNWPLNAIHTVLTPDGRVMNYGSDQSGNQGALCQGAMCYDVWTPSTNAHSLLLQTVTRVTDIFCSAQVVLPGGLVLLAGGDSRGVDPNHVNDGVPDVNFFDPSNNQLTAGPRMFSARWYGTVVPLADGRVLTLAGLDATGAGAAIPEIYTPAQGQGQGSWKNLTQISSWPADYFYPRAFLAPNGKVLVASASSLYSIDPDAPSMTQIGTLPKTLNWMLPWAIYDRGKVLLIADDGSAVMLDVNGTTPVATVVAGPGANRVWGNATVLPDGKVLVTGGSATDNELVDTAYSAMIWDPATKQWSVGAAAQKPRLYHSNAILLPDATVLTSGGGSPGPVTNLNAEVYSPPYLFDSTGQPAARPIINTTPAQVNLGSTFRITVASSLPIQRVTLMRTGSVTHSTDFGQRFLELPFTQAAGDSNVDIQINESPNTLPIGHYMLFVIDSAGVPSVAKIVKVDATWTQVAQQGQSLILPSTTPVQYGSTGKVVMKTLSGTVSCRNEFFGTNPSPTIGKGCYVLSPLASSITLGSQGITSDRQVAAEGAAFNMAAATVVSYGTGTSWIQKTVTGAGTCSNAFFGSDPAPFVVKSCVADTGIAAPPPAPPPPPPPPPPPSPPPPPPPAPPPSGGVTLAAEGGTFTVATPTVVSYGADTRWIQKTVTGTGSCTNAFFGSDPAPFTVKSCVGPSGTPPPPAPPPPPPPPAPPSGTTLAAEGGTFTVATATLVSYGADTRWVQKTVTGTVPCTNAFFGTDPAPFVVKRCVAGS